MLARLGRGDKMNYGKRKLSVASIGKDLEAYKDICTNLELSVVESCLKELKYI